MALASRRLAATVAAASAGAAAKIVGSLYGSRAVLADAMTSVANMVALAGILAYYKASMRPADLDHPYGHVRLKYAGALLAALVYMFVAGVAAAELVESIRGYSIGGGSWKAALVGGLFYLAAIAASRGIDPVLRVYAGFTASELLESVVSTVSSFAGYTLSYTIDLAGAAVIVAYILYEVRETASTIVELVADKAAPRSVYDTVAREARLRGLRPLQLRIRKLDVDRYEGDAVMVPEDENMPPDVADLLADELREELARRGIELTIHVGYAERREAKRRGEPGGKP